MLGYSTPTVPPILFAAVAIDLVARAGRPWLTSVVTAVAVVVSYLPLLGPLPSIEPVPRERLLAGVVLAFAAAALVGAMGSCRGRRVALLGLGGVAGLAFVTIGAAPSEAHDPGQGRLVGQATFRVEVEGLMIPWRRSSPKRSAIGGRPPCWHAGPVRQSGRRPR